MPNVTWSTLRLAGNAPLMKLTIVAPFLPYILAAIDFVARASTSEPTLDRNLVDWASDASMSLHLFYFGGSLLGVASALFLIFCPDPVRKYEDGINYADREAATFSKATADAPDAIRLKLQNRYNQLDLSRTAMRRTTFTLYLLGFALVLAPPVHRFFLTLAAFLSRATS